MNNGIDPLPQEQFILSHGVWLRRRLADGSTTDDTLKELRERVKALEQELKKKKKR
jgi:hypothetical protein